MIGSRCDPRAAAADNVLDGRIVRHAYLGEARDYLVSVPAADLTLRVVTSAKQLFKPNQTVCLAIAAGACRVLLPDPGLTRDS